MKVYIQWPFSPDGKKLVFIKRRKAITEKCLNCSGFDYESRRNCEHTDCPLYSYRTGIGKQNSKARNRAIRAFCREDCMWGNSSYLAKCTSPDCVLYAYRMARLDRSVEVEDSREEVQI